MKTRTSTVLSLISIGMLLAAIGPLAADSNGDNHIENVRVVRSVDQKLDVGVSGTVKSVPLKLDEKQSVYAGSDFGLQFQAQVADDEGASLTYGRDEKNLVTLTAQEARQTVNGPRGPMNIWGFEDIALGDSKATAYIRKDGDDLSLSVRCGSPAYLHATVKLAGTDYTMLVVDSDWDGVYGSAADSWAVVTEKTLEQRAQKSFGSSNLIEIDEPCYLERDQVVRFVGHRGNKCELALAPATDTFGNYLSRRHARLMKKFLPEGDDQKNSRLDRYIEPGREKAEKPVVWLFAVDLVEAKQLATEQEKLLLVDFETDWCHWCHVMDAVTFTDAEVAEFVAQHFVPVKINCEFLVEPLDKKYGASGYPTFVVLKADGDVAGKFSGFSKPTELLKTVNDIVYPPQDTDPSEAIEELREEVRELKKQVDEMRDVLERVLEEKRPEEKGN